MCHQDIRELGSPAARVAVLQRPPEYEGGPESVAVERGAIMEEPVLGGESPEVNTVQTNLRRVLQITHTSKKFSFVLSQRATAVPVLQCTRLI